MPGSSMNLLLPSIHELHEPCGITANSCLAAPYPVRNRRVSISSSISSRTSSVSPPPSLITTRTTSSPSPPPPSISRPKVRFVRVDSWENADAALLYPPPEAPHVPKRQDIMSGASSQGRPSGPLLLVGRAMEHLRGPDRCIAKGARIVRLSSEVSENRGGVCTIIVAGASLPRVGELRVSAFTADIKTTSILGLVCINKAERLSSALFISFMTALKFVCFCFELGAKPVPQQNKLPGSEGRFPKPVTSYSIVIELQNLPWRPIVDVFENTFDVVRGELLNHISTHGMPPDAIDRYIRIIDYNVPGGKLNRGLSVPNTVQVIKGRALTDTEFTKASVLGWAIEFLQAVFLVTDDMMDRSLTRRGQPCWYRKDDVGTLAVNDAMLLESAIYQMLRTHFRRTPYYADLLDLFHDTAYQTEMGQLVDLITAPQDKVDLSKFSLERHSIIVTYKTAYYSFYLPVAAAMLMCQIPRNSSPLSNPYQAARSILLPLGEYFQVQDDFLDFAGTPEQLGKIGTDIVDNKCSWCINTALAISIPAQRAVLDANYGRKDVDCERRVKAVFEEVGIRARYETYEADAYRRISEMIDQVLEDAGVEGEVVLKRDVFRKFLEKIYKRQK
ncbi:hypothetical protein EW146_g9412 [Bondarzewia mesenterica]|uniref:(2E,6E)-farnesyl diphosphate synthase n=1 Tax=Bondarzewia mesenterica TaxID=1095465 RepID=A0A4S4L6J1_9AGAM|nr:hypothetical protein EW146_g9412 [Bondarzewia mesenterica]